MRQDSGTTGSKRHSLCLNYGTINQEDSCGAVNSIARGSIYPVENDILQPMQDQLNEILKAEQIKYTNNNGIAESLHDAQTQNGFFAAAETDLNDDAIVQMEKDNLDLRRELQDALTNKKQADMKIQTYGFVFASFLLSTLY